MVTARVDEIDRLLGLELGADDYICKPFSPREVVARVKAVLRRLKRGDAPQETGLTLDESGYKATVAGKDLGLTAVEFELLKVLALHPNKPLSRQRILELAHGRDWDPLDRSIDIRITRLRQKIEEVPARPRLIRTVRGIGYMFVPGGD